MAANGKLLLVALAGVMAGLYLHEVLAFLLALGLAVLLFIHGLHTIKKHLRP